MHSTSNVDDGYMGSGRRLTRSIRKYGGENHTKEILEFFPNRELLIEREKELITSDMIQDINCMNLMSGGTGGFISVENQRYRSQCAGKANALKCKTNIEHANKRKKNICDAIKLLHQNGKYTNVKKPSFSGMTHSIETRIKIGESNKKNSLDKHSQYSSCWIMKDGDNKKIKKEELDYYLSFGWLRGRNINGDRISDNIIDEINNLYAIHKSPIKIAKILGLSKSTIFKYLKN
jgi:hypothetical protein